jgi:hypothetical protein
MPAGEPVGPGPVTADGCPVELYRLLPAAGEPQVVHAAVPSGATASRSRPAG